MNSPWPARVRTVVPGIPVNRRRSAAAMSSLDRRRSRCGTSATRISPTCVPAARQPIPPRLVAMFRASGTSRVMICSMGPTVSSSSDSRVPTSISTVTRTSPSSPAGMSSVPTKGISAALPARRRTAAAVTASRWSSAACSRRR
jgi:hypothetical protein